MRDGARELDCDVTCPCVGCIFGFGPFEKNIVLGKESSYNSVLLLQTQSLFVITLKHTTIETDVIVKDMCDIVVEMHKEVLLSQFLQIFTFLFLNLFPNMF